MGNRFGLETFFDLNKFEFNELFREANQAWEVLPNIHTFIIRKTKETYIPNYANKSVYIGKGTVIEEGALIKGPAIIGKNCFIAHGAYLRENCVLGDDVRVGHGTEIKNSVLLNKSSCSHFNYVGDSIIGNNVNISAGAILANHRLDKKNILVQTDSLKIDTNLNKFGAIVGDSSIVGVNAVLNPGTILGKKCVVYPLVCVKGIYPKDSLIQ